MSPLQGIWKFDLVDGIIITATTKCFSFYFTLYFLDFICVYRLVSVSSQDETNILQDLNAPAVLYQMFWHRLQNILSILIFCLY